MKITSGALQFGKPWLARMTVLAVVIVLTTGVPSVGRTAENVQQVVHLYFADAAQPFLVSEERVMVDTDDAVRFGRQLVTELLDGPATSGKLATIPEGTRLRAFYLLPDGTAVVDFSAHFRDNHPGGCRREQLTLFSVVNSLVLNEPAIDRVKILIDGAETETLAGHVALEFPFTADMLLTR